MWVIQGPIAYGKVPKTKSGEIGSVPMCPDVERVARGIGTHPGTPDLFPTNVRSFQLPKNTLNASATSLVAPRWGAK